MKSNLRFALAVNEQHVLAPKHFGDADKFLLYHYCEEGIELYKELRNPAKRMEHGSEQKAKLLIDLLRDENVDILVSKKFGGNLSRVNQYFIPVIISLDSPEDVLHILQNHIHWLMEERSKEDSSYQLFQINQGILKTSVKREKPLKRNMFF